MNESWSPKGKKINFDEKDWDSTSEEENGASFAFKSRRFVSKENANKGGDAYEHSSSDDDILHCLDRRKNKVLSSAHKLNSIVNKRQKEPLKSSKTKKRSNVLLAIDSSSSSSSSESDDDPSRSSRHRQSSSNEHNEVPGNSRLVELLDSESDSNDEFDHTYGKKNMGESRNTNSLTTSSSSKVRITRSSQKTLLKSTANSINTKCATEAQTDNQTANLMKKAKEARERLLTAQKYHAEDIIVPIGVEDDGDEVKVENDEIKVTKNIDIMNTQQPKTPSINISLRTNIVSKPPGLGSMPSIHGTTTVFRMSMGDKIQKLMDDYKQKFHSAIGSDSDVKFSFDGETLTNCRTPNDMDMEDGDLVDVIVKLISIPNLSNNPCTKSSHHIQRDSERVTITTRIKNGNQNITHKYQLRKKDSFSKLVQAYKDKHGYSSFKKISLFYRGKQIMDLNSSPHLEDMPNAFDIDIEDDTERRKQLSSTHPSIPVVNNNGLPMSTSSGNTINLKIRRNGSDNSIQNYSMNHMDKFRSMVDQYLQKNGLEMRQCKFIFDGVSLNMNSTPDEEDLEGGEIIDVQVNAKKSARNQHHLTPQESPIVIDIDNCDNQNKPNKPRSLSVRSDTRSNSSQMTQSVLKSFFQAQTSLPRRKNDIPSTTSHVTPTRTIEKSVMIVQTYRNNNTQYKPKKFKLYNTDTISKLKAGYIAYYKSKGCRSVRFYFNNVLIEDEAKTFAVLGLQNQAILHAIENNKKYRDV